MPQPFAQSSSDLSPQSSGDVDSARSSVPASVGELLASATGPLFSFEFFPPRSEEDEPVLWAAVEALAPHEPAFVSVTYGANGSRRDRTVAATRRIAASGGPLTVKALKDGKCDTADIYSADPSIASNNLTTLSDPKSLVLPQNVVPVVSAKVDEKAAAVIDKVSAALTTDELVGLNALSVNKQQSSSEIAKTWLTSKGLLG